jgi:hypothetical protein
LLLLLQGTLVALAAFSEGRMVDKLKSAALLSPVAYLSHITTPIGVVLAKAFAGEVKIHTEQTMFFMQMLQLQCSYRHILFSTLNSALINYMFQNCSSSLISLASPSSTQHRMAGILVPFRQIKIIFTAWNRLRLLWS